MKTRAPFIWIASQPINQHGFLRSFGAAAPRHDGQNRWLLFRREVQMDAPPASFPIRLTVDGRYTLYVNGTFVGRGPIRCSPLFQRYDRYDIAPHLTAGANVVSLVVHSYGVDTSFYETVKGMWHETFGDGALWLEGETTETAAFDTGHNWRALLSTAWNSNTARMNLGLGFIEDLDARALPSGWHHAGFDDSSWDEVHALIAGGGGPECFFGGLETRPFPTLIARSIPMLDERLVMPERFVRADGLLPDPSLPLERRCYDEVAMPLLSGLVDDATKLCADNIAPVTIRTTDTMHVSLLFDFGTLLTGHPRIDVDARGGEIIEIAVSEHLPGDWTEAGIKPDARITRKPLLGLDAHVARYVARPGRQVFERFEWSAIRWMQVTIRDATEGMIVHSIGATATNYPVEHRGSFSSSDPFLDRLWSVGAYTLHQCMHDAWEDCPSREQRQWLGDATVEHLVGQAAFGPCVTSLNALFLRQAAESQRNDGLTQMYAPGDHKTNGLLIPDWTLQWILNAGDHYLYSGDLETIEAIFPSIQKALAWFDQHLSPAGLVADMPYWHFMDWAAVGRGGEACTLNALLAGCFDVAATLADALDNRRAAETYKQRGDAIRTALHARHWDETRGVYVDMVDPSTGTQNPRVSQHANAAMALWGAVPPERLARMFERITDPARLVFTPAPPITNHAAAFDEGENVVLANTFFAHFVYGALANAGKLADALAMMRARLGPMIDMGSPTLWESLEPSASLCHGFSASPTYQLSSRMLGIRPASPGFARAHFAPDLAGLASAKGCVPTPHGDIHISLTATLTGFQAQIDAPEKIVIQATAMPGMALVGGEQSFSGAATFEYRRR
jgi:alpha-L-rhamnosidase